MTNCKLSYRGGHSILLAMQRYQKLRELTLDKNVFDGSKLRVLREMLSSNKGLKTLNMNQCSLGQDACLYISLGFLKNTSLKQLSLCENNFGDEGIEYFSQHILTSGRDFKLEYLDLSSNFITDE